MRINNNLMAMNTHRQLGIATNGGAKSMEKLSSGFRINRAGDDAAGLAISEKMRGQIRGLNQASSNAQDGISLIQTAEGALNETHAILQRMRELAVQSSTDTNTETDRGNIQDEINELTDEITRIAETTEFNTMKLLDGTFENKNFHIGANSKQNVGLEVSAMDSDALGLLEAAGNGSVVSGNSLLSGGTLEGVTIIDKKGNITELTMTKPTDKEKINIGDPKDGKVAIEVGEDVLVKDFVAAMEEKGYRVEIDETKYNGGTKIGDVSNENITMKRMTEIKNPQKSDITVDLSGAGNHELGIVDNTGKLTDVKINVSDASGASEIKAEIVDGTLNLTLSKTDAQNTSGAIQQAIADATGTKDVYTVTKKGNLTTAQTADMSVDIVSIGEEVDKKSTLDVSTREAADKSITTVNNALETVSKQRSKLGAMQNRLEHTIKNLDTSAENLQQSESRIRDVDMAKEMMEQTKNNILQQASQAMLAQANQAPQGVLQLLG